MHKKLHFFILSTLLPVTLNAQTKPDDAVSPDWKSAIPRVVFPEQEMVDLYEKTWEIAADRVRKGPEGLPSSPYLDENCYEDQIWIWDACFMVMFSKYAPDAFPGKETLNNLYYPIHENTPTPLRIHLRDNPPLFAWVEHDNYKFTGDKSRIDLVLNQKAFLQRHFDYFNTVEKGDKLPAISPNAIHRGVIKENNRIIGYTWTGGASGMDNTPRGRESGGYDKVMWVDAIAQQALSALYIARLQQQQGNKEQSRLWNKRYEELKKTINDRYWDETDGFYYDVTIADNKPCKVKTIASYWPMFAEVATKKQAEKLVEKLKDENLFGGKYPWVTLSRDDKDHNGETGDYWRGGIWLPTAYMGTKALEKYGYYELADEMAENIVRQQLRTYHAVTPHTIWECYSPSRDLPSTEHGRRARPDFCGWSALGPISLFIENVLGFREVNGAEKSVNWSLKEKNGKHGIRNLRFGGITADMVYEPAEKKIRVKCNQPFTLTVNNKRFKVKAGESELAY